jgi:hypothetical protein
MNSSLTHNYRLEALLASPRVAFRRLALVLVLASTTDLTTVAYRALRASPSRYSKLHLPPPILVFSVANSRVRVSVGLLCLLPRLKPLRSKNSLVSVTSTRPASLHFKLARVPRRHSMTPMRAPYSWAGLHLQRTK